MVEPKRLLGLRAPRAIAEILPCSIENRETILLVSPYGMVRRMIASVDVVTNLAGYELCRLVLYSSKPVLSRIKYIVYRIEQALVITRTELKALLVLSCMLLLGSGVKYWRVHRPVFSPSEYLELEAAFLNHVDSLEAEGLLRPAKTAMGSNQTSPAATPPARIVEFPVDINTADTFALEALPGIGPALARRIVEYREENGPFQSIDDLDYVSGIGPAKLNSLRQKVTLSE